MELGSVPFLVPVWLSLIAVVAVTVYNLRSRSKPCALPLAVMGTLIAIWCLAFSLELLSSDLQTMRIIEQFEFLEGGLGAAVLWYVLEYIQPGRRLSKRQLLLVFAAPVVLFLVSLTNFAHQLYFRGAFVAHLGPLSLLGYESRIMAWVDGAVGIAFYLAAVSILISHIMRMPPIYRGQSWGTVGALIFPGLIGLIFLFEIVPYYLGDFLVTGFALGTLLLHWIAHQAGIAELMPFAHDLLYRQIDQIVVVLDRNMRVIEINPAGQRVFGEAARWAVGEPLNRLLPGIDLPCGPNLARSDQIPIGERVFMANCSPIQDIQGKSYGWLVLFYDSTEQLHLHEALTSSEARYRSLAEAANDAIVIIQDGKLVYANQRCMEMGGYSQEELIGQDFIRFLRPEDHEQIMRAYLRRLSGSPSGGLVESALLTKDGSWRHLEYNTGLIEYQGRLAVVAYLRDITPRKQAEAELQRLSTAVMQNPAMIMIFDPQGRVEYVNPKFCEVTGYAPEDVLGGKVSLFEQGDGGALVADEFWRELQPGSAWKGVFQNHKKSGEHYWAETHISPIVDKRGDITQYLVIQEDITRRKLAEEALQASQARLEAVFNNRQVGIGLVNAEGRFLQVNDQLADLLGYSVAEMLTKSNLDITYPDDRKATEEQFRALVHKEQPSFKLEKRYLCKDGGILWGEITSTPIVGEDGQVVATISFMSDITSRKEIEQRLRDSEELYRSIVTVSPDDISITDLAGRIELVSPAGLRMFGYAPEEALQGKSLAEFVAPADRERFKKDVARLVQGTETGILEYYGLRKNGTLFEFETNGGVLRDGKGKPKSLVFVVRDITERRRIEASERQRIQELEVLRATLQDISAELELPRLLKAIVERMVGLMNVRDSELAMYHEDTQELEIVVSYLKERDYTGTIMQLGEGCMGVVAQTRQSMVVDNYAEWEGRSPQYLASHTSIVAVPLVSGARLLGVLAVGDEAAQRKFNHRDMQLLEMFAQQAVIAIQNAELFSEVQRLATIDPLTGILNRRSFFERAMQEFTRSRRYHTPLSLVMLDLDHFKKINDTFGHLIGDKALSEISRTCAAQIRASDFVGRYGGEEFVVLLPETSLEGALSIAQRLCETIRDVTIESKQGLVKVTASVGVAELMEDYASLDVLLEHADAALYRAKEAGRNRVSV